MLLKADSRTRHSDGRKKVSHSSGFLREVGLASPGLDIKVTLTRKGNPMPAKLRNGLRVMGVEGKSAAVSVLLRLEGSLVKSGTAEEAGQFYRFASLCSNVCELGYRLVDGAQVQSMTGSCSSAKGKREFVGARLRLLSGSHALAVRNERPPVRVDTERARSLVTAGSLLVLVEGYDSGVDLDLGAVLELVVEFVHVGVEVSEPVGLTSLLRCSRLDERFVEFGQYNHCCWLSFNFHELETVTEFSGHRIFLSG